MLDIGLQEMLVIGVIALLVFGPSKLPELGRMFGRALREFRRASDEFRTTVETNLHINDTEPVPPSAPTMSDDTTTAMLPSEAEPQFAEPATAPAVTSPPLDVGEPYCAQRGARLFHRRECGWASRIPEVDRIYLKRVVDAREQGFAECPVCAPWEPA